MPKRVQKQNKRVVNDGREEERKRSAPKDVKVGEERSEGRFQREGVGGKQ